MKPGSEAVQLAFILKSVIREQVGNNESVALMFSGGLDSATLAVIARKICDVNLYTIGTEGSIDLRWAAECAAILDLPLVSIVVDANEVPESIGRVVRTHGMRKPKWMSTFVAFDMLLRRIPERVIVCGQGADELFGGYRKYREKAGMKARMEKDLSELRDEEWPAYQRMAGNLGRELLAPFLDPKLASFVATLPSNMLISNTDNKLVLRNAAEFLGVPGMMARRPKKAMQYGSGISKSIKRYLKVENITLEALILGYED